MFIARTCLGPYIYVCVFIVIDRGNWLARVVSEVKVNSMYIISSINWGKCILRKMTDCLDPSHLLFTSAPNYREAGNIS